jgi:hypothetical protein
VARAGYVGRRAAVFADSAAPALLAWAMPAQMLLLAALLADAVRYGVRLDLVN